MAWMVIGYLCAVIGLLHAGYSLGEWIGVEGVISLWAIMSIYTWTIVLILRLR